MDDYIIVLERLKKRLKLKYAYLKFSYARETFYQVNV